MPNAKVTAADRRSLVPPVVGWYVVEHVELGDWRVQVQRLSPVGSREACHQALSQLGSAFPDRRFFLRPALAGLPIVGKQTSGPAALLG